MSDQQRKKELQQQLDDHIRSVVDQAPPLTDEQRVRLAALLAPEGPRR